MRSMVYGRFFGKVFGVIGITLITAVGTGCGGSVSGSAASAGTSSTGKAGTGGTTGTTSSGSTPSTTGIATLSWTPPSENTDGTTITSLVGYRVYYGTSSDALTKTVDVSGSAVTSYEITNLTAGTYYFAIAALAPNGAESALSDTASKTI